VMLIGFVSQILLTFRYAKKVYDLIDVIVG
jgi:hypothetical protein